MFGGLGKALMAPIRATNKVVGKLPGMQSAMGAVNKIPGMSTANKLNPMMSGLIKPQQKQGLSPSPQAQIPQMNPMQSINPMQSMQQMPEMNPDQGGMSPSPNMLQNLYKRMQMGSQ
jgi:hypothetical protein